MHRYVSLHPTLSSRPATRTALCRSTQPYLLGQHRSSSSLPHSFFSIPQRPTPLSSYGCRWHRGHHRASRLLFLPRAQLSARPIPRARRDPHRLQRLSFSFFMSSPHLLSFFPLFMQGAQKEPRLWKWIRPSPTSSTPPVAGFDAPPAGSVLIGLVYSSPWPDLTRRRQIRLHRTGSGCPRPSPDPVEGFDAPPPDLPPPDRIRPNSTALDRPRSPSDYSHLCFM